MDQKLIEYRNKIERYLRPLDAAERADIVKEIESEMFELSQDGISPDAIIERLGGAKELASAYLGDSIVQGRFHFKKIGVFLAFYFLSGISGLIVLPFTVISALAFMISGIMIPIAGIIKFAAHLQGTEMMQIGINFDGLSVGAVAFLPLSFIIGAITFAVGVLAWKLTLLVIRIIGKSRKTIDNHL